MKPSKSALAVCASLVFALSACAAKRASGFDERVKHVQLEGPAQAQYDAAKRDADAAWVKREDVTQAQAALAKYKEAAGLKPDDWEAWTMASRAAYFIADGTLQFDETKRKEYLDLHNEGVTFAEKALAAYSSEFETRVRAGTKVEDAVDVIGEKGVAPLYWYATNLGKWSNAMGFATRLKNKDRIFKVITRVADLDSDYFYGAADRYFGAFYAIAPAFAGGDLDKSLEHFKKSTERYPYYLATHVLLAEFYFTKRQDKEAFKKELEFVLSVPDNAIPEVTAENKIEKAKAQRLMAKIDDLF
jgi:TRAP transporter T-component